MLRSIKPSRSALHRATEGARGPSNKEYLDSWVKRRFEAMRTDSGREIGLQTYLRPLCGT
jgi:hypothetical protein